MTKEAEEKASNHCPYRMCKFSSMDDIGIDIVQGCIGVAASAIV